MEWSVNCIIGKTILCSAGQENEANGTECILCGGCVDVCPENCLSLVPLKEFAFSEEDKARLSAEIELRPLDLQHISPEALNQIEGAVMVKDETICIRCGLCAERCPAHTISMDSFQVFDEEQGMTVREEIVLRP